MSLSDFASLRSILCPICSARLDPTPKKLSCHHTFCRHCLTLLLSTNMVTCPICQNNTPVPNGNLDALDSDVTLQSLIYDVTNMHQLCTNCDSNQNNDAVRYCKICDLFMCNMCFGKHDALKPTKSHPTFLVDDIRKGEVYLDNKVPCKNHRGDEGRHFCTLVCVTCKKAICEECKEVVHGEHDVKKLTEYEAESQSQAESLRNKADREMGNTKRRTEEVITAESASLTHINSVIRSTHERAATIIREVKDRENILIEQSEEHKQSISQKCQAFRRGDERMMAELETAIELLRRNASCQFGADTAAIRTYLKHRLTRMVTSEVEEIEFHRQLDEISRSATQIQFIPDENELLLGHITFNDLASSSRPTAYNVPPSPPSTPRDRWRLSRDIALPDDSPMQCLTATPDGKLAVGRKDTGITICSKSGHVERKPSISVISDVSGLAFNSKDYCVTRTRHNTIAMFTTYWDKLDVKFRPNLTTRTFLKTGPCGNLTIDGDDNIYINHVTDEKIEIFAANGGKPLRTIECRGFKPREIFAMKSRKILLVSSSDQSVSLIDEFGRKKKQIQDPGRYVFCTLRPDDSILLARVKRNARLLTIQHFSQDLELLDTIIRDHRFTVQSEPDWFALQETSDGDIAFCTSERLYLFSRLSE